MKINIALFLEKKVHVSAHKHDTVNILQFTELYPLKRYGQHLTLDVTLFENTFFADVVN